MGTRRTSVEWSKLLARYRKSGESQSAFCDRNGVSLATLHYQLKKEGSLPSGEIVPATFVELSSNTLDSKVEIELSLPSGAVLRVRG